MQYWVNKGEKANFHFRQFPTVGQTLDYTRCQINQDRMIFGDFSVNSEPIILKFCKGHFLFKS